MALNKAAVVVVLVASILLITSAKVSPHAGVHHPQDVALGGYPAPAPLGPPPHKIADPKDCVGACDERCSLHSRKNVCGRACLTCCGVCRCVPAGTAGNREACGKCYTDWTTHGNKTKCP